MTVKQKLRIAFVRRGYSRSGGAEAYLKRLADGIVKACHEVQLVTTNEWPKDQWPVGPIKRLGGTTVIGFADELEQIRLQFERGADFDGRLARGRGRAAQRTGAADHDGAFLYVAQLKPAPGIHWSSSSLRPSFVHFVTHIDGTALSRACGLDCAPP